TLRDRLLTRRARLAGTRVGRPQVRAPGRGRPSDRQSRQGEESSWLEAQGQLPATGRDDGRSRLGATAPTMRVLVTGADGFVGRHLCGTLVERGDEVLACGGPDRPHGLDVINREAVLERFRAFEPEGVIHLAGVSSVSWSHQNLAETMKVNVLGTTHVL